MDIDIDKAIKVDIDISIDIVINIARDIDINIAITIDIDIDGDRHYRYLSKLTSRKQPDLTHNMTWEPRSAQTLRTIRFGDSESL